MRFGIVLPVDIPGVSGGVLIDWLNRINGGPFETVAVADEIVSANYESLVILSAAAALTRSVRLISVVIVGPTRNTAILAKQSASIDALSGGRLSLGLGVGELVDDFSVAGADNAVDAYLAASYAGTPDYDLQAMRDVTPRTAPDVHMMIERIESTGAHELIFHPISANIDQLERLEQIVG